MNILVKACIQVLEVLAMTTKYCNSSTKGLLGGVSRRTKDYLREFIGGSEVKTALEKLQHLTNAELLAAVAHNNAISRDIQPKIHFVANEAVVWGIRQWLKPPSEQPLNWEKKRHLDSCQWFFDDTFESWKVQRNRRSLIIPEAGAGKSVLCSSIIDTLKKDPTLSLVYFNFDFSDTTKQDCRALAASLVFQLATCSEACQNYLRRQQTSTAPTYDELLVMLSNLVKLAGHVYIVIDALDECPEQERDRGSARFLQHLCELDSGEKDFRLLVTSRPEADIWVLLSSVTHILSLSDSGQHQKDVSAYIASQLDRNEYRWSPDVKAKVHEVLNERSNGMTVQFIHFSAKEYFTSAELKGATTLAHHYVFDDYSANLTLTKICFWALEVDTAPLNLRKYADEYWTGHISPQNEDDLDYLLDTFLRSGSASFTRWAVSKSRWGKDDTVFHCAARLNLCHHVEKMLAQSLSKAPSPFSFLTTIRARYRRSVLHDAAMEGHTEMCRLLLSHDGALVEDLDEDGDTPLHMAALNGHKNVVRMLLEQPAANGADPAARCRARNKHGQTLLHRAAYGGYADICRLLLDHGALVDDTDEDGDTPVHNAQEEEASSLRMDMQWDAEKDPEGPWRAILDDFASQLEDPEDGSESESD
ncbi:unnamed protein product [Peniophora sp. CBMAI 1063]|nr:unnamed protein product [Peniophora sp. CBMAI 1063]